MHELGRYLQRNLEDRGWTVSELIRRSGLSRQTVYNLLNDSREHMDQTPQRKTVNGLAKALGVTQTEVLTVSARAIGVPLEPTTSGQTLNSATDEQILHELASRLSRSKDQDDESRPQKSVPTKRHLRSMAPVDHLGAGQKTESDDYPKPNDIVYELDRLGIKQLHEGDPETTEAPEDMAAHPYFETQREKFERIHGERGEENQDPEGHH